MVYLCGTSRIYSAFLNRLRGFRQIALSEVVGSSVGVLARLLFGIPKFLGTMLHTIGLPLGVLLGRLTGNINLRIQYNKLRKNYEISRQERRDAAKKYRNFPLYTMPKELINSLSYNLPFIWLALYFDKAEVGLFSLALTCTFRPVNIINTAMERLLYVRITEKVHKKESIAPDIINIVKWLNIIALPIFIVAFFFAGEMFSFLFGGRWSGCGFYFRCQLPWVYIMLTSTSLMFLSYIFSKQRVEFIFFIVLFVLRVVAMVVGIVTSSFHSAIMLFCISGAVVSFALLCWLAHLVWQYERDC